MQHIRLYVLHEEKLFHRKPMLRYLSKLQENALCYDNERYYYNESERKVAIEGNTLVLASFLAEAQRLFLHEGASFDWAWLEFPPGENKNKMGRLWFCLKPNNRENRMFVRFSEKKYDNIEHYELGST